MPGRRGVPGVHVHIHKRFVSYQNLDDQSKSRALTEAGVEEYEIHLVHQAEFDKIADIKNYFLVALKYDPTNARAQQYLSLVDDYKNAQLRTNLRAASRALQKPKRSDDENYAIFVSLQTAIKIRPGQCGRSEDAQRYGFSVRSTPDQLLPGKGKSRNGQAGRQEPGLQSRRSSTRRLSSRLAGRCQSTPPAPTLRARAAPARSELAKLVTRRVELAQKAIAAGNFKDARKQVTALNDLNRAPTTLSIPEVPPGHPTH